jgi:predicted transposase YdaD
MLMTEWNWDDALAVRYEEGKEDGQEEVALNALAEGLPIDIIQKITGLDIGTVKKIQATGQTSYMKMMHIPGINDTMH